MGMGQRPARPLVGAVALLVAACGGADVVSGEPAAHAYHGPLYVTRDAAEHPKAGAAGDVVDCQTWGDGGFSDADVYGEGATADSPEGALKEARSEGGFGGVQEGLRVAKREDHRVLYVLEVGGVVKQAVIVHDGPATEGAGGPGWYVESWAHCDYSELPAYFTDSIDLQIWTDPSGHPAPTSVIAAWKGPEHCGWQSMTFLELGQAVFVRNPQPELGEYFAEQYDEHAQLPADAADTGYERDGEHLWLSSDKQRAFVGTVDDVEVWPRTIRPLGCA
jgi:hypothetical protein